MPAVPDSEPLVWEGIVFAPMNSGEPIPPETLAEMSRDPNPDIAPAEELCNTGDLKTAIARIDALLPHHRVQSFGRCLSRASRVRADEIVQALLARGVIPGYHHAEPAIDGKHLKVLSLLKDGGWDINDPIFCNVPPPLCRAVEGKHVDRAVVMWFLENGADPDRMCNLNITPLSSAVQLAPLEIVELLINHVPGGRPSHGELLHYAAVRTAGDCAQVIRLVLERTSEGVNDFWFRRHIFSASQYEWSGLGAALHFAAGYGTPESVAELLASGANVKLRDKLGRTPVDLAREEGNDKVLEVLLKAEAGRANM